MNAKTALGAYSTDFFSKEELLLSQEFLEQGYIIRPVDDSEALKTIREAHVELAVKFLECKAPNDSQSFLDNIHKEVSVEKLNDTRLFIFNNFNSMPWARKVYFTLARKALEILVGNELVMQKRINLSIQLPDDDSSLLPVHSDVWSGDSPFEVVVWLPLVDCYKTKSMFLLPPEQNDVYANRMQEFGTKGSAEFFKEIEPHVHWLDVPFGNFLLFAHTLMHGNIVNREAESRWSMNCRFKSALSPYWDKGIADFFEPITLRAATKVGMEYRLPRGFRE